MHTHRTARNPVLHWLITRLAWHLEVPTHAVDPTVPLAEIGVDSVRAVGLVGDIEVHWDIDVDPTLVFDYPTLAHIAEYISCEIQQQRLVTA